MSKKTLAIQLAQELNNYDGDNAWQDVVYSYDFDQATTDEHDSDSTLVVFPAEGEITPAVKYVEMDKDWIPTTLEAVLAAQEGFGVGAIRRARLS